MDPEGLGSEGLDPGGLDGLGRRGFLRRAAVGGGVLLGGGALLAFAGYAAPPGVGALVTLSEREACILAAASARILAGSVADLAPVVAATVQFVDGYLARRDPWVRDEVRALLAGLELSPPLFAGRLGRFTGLDGAGQDAVLAAWSGSRLAPCRQGYLGLKGMVLMGGYAQPALLRAIGYDGPPY